MIYNMRGDAYHAGPVMLSDVYTSAVGSAEDGVAASQRALYDAYNSLNSSIRNVVPLILFYKYNVDFLSNGFKVNNDGCGCIFQYPLLTNSIRFKKNEGYGQWGNCNKNGIMPTIINTGQNRLNFDASYSAGTFTMYPIYAESLVFFGGHTNTIFTDFEIILANGAVIKAY